MKALQIVNKSNIKVCASYWTPLKWGIIIKGGITIFYVNFNDDKYEVIPANNFKEENLAITIPLRPFISVEIVEIENKDSCTEMQIPFPPINYKEFDTSIESLSLTAKKEWTDAGSPTGDGFSQEQYEGSNSL